MDDFENYKVKIATGEINNDQQTLNRRLRNVDELHTDPDKLKRHRKWYRNFKATPKNQTEKSSTTLHKKRSCDQTTS